MAIELTTVSVETAVADSDEFYFNDVSETPDALNRVTFVNLLGTALSALRTVFVAASSSAAALLRFHEDTDNGSNYVEIQAPASVASNKTQTLQDRTGTISLTDGVGDVVELGFAVSDETTNLSTGTAKITFRMPHAMTLTAVRASVNTAPTGSTIIVDINEGGSTILSTKLSIDASEKTSTTAASAAVISDTALADDAEITIDIDQIGSSTPGKGLKVYLIGTRA
jgi:hypothetical protein